MGFSLGKLRFGFSNAGGSAASFIKWLLPFNLGLSATIGDDAVSGGTSVTYAKVFDETYGIVIKGITAGSPVSEGMRWTGTEFVNNITSLTVKAGDSVVTGERAFVADAAVQPTGLYDRIFIADARPTRVIQKGYIRTVIADIAVMGGDNSLQFCVYRDNGSTYDLVSNSEELTATTLGEETFILSTPMYAEPKDIIGVRFPETTSVEISATSSSISDAVRYNTSGTGLPANNAFTGTFSYTLNVQGYMDRPALCVSGDSIVAGFNTIAPFRSYFDTSPYGIDGTITSEPMNQLSDQFSLTAGFALPYQNHAKSGQTFAWVASTGSVPAYAANPLAMIVHAGTNDISASVPWSSVETSLDTILAGLPSGTTLFIDEILPRTNLDDAKSAIRRTWNSNLATWCTDNGATLIELQDAFGQLRVSTGELDDLKTAYNYDGTHLTQAGIDALADAWHTQINSALDLSIESLTPTKTGSSDEEIMLVMDGWAGATQVVALGAYAVGRNGNHYYYYKATTGGTTGSTEPTWPTSGTVADGSVVWTFQGRYNNLGAGHLTHVLGEPSRTNSVKYSGNPLGLTWTRRGTFAATKNLIGADGEVNSGYTVSGLDAAGVGDFFQLVTGLTASTRHEPSIIIKQISTTGVISLSKGSAADGETGLWEIDLSKLNGLWESVDRDHTAVTIIEEFQSSSLGNSGLIIFKSSGVGTVSIGYYGVQLEEGETSTSYIPTTIDAVTRDATDFSSARVITEQFIRVRVADIQSQTYLSDGTNELIYDLASTTLTFTDGTTTLTNVEALAVADTIAIDQTDGKLYVNGVLKDTDGALAPTWSAVTAISNGTDIYESSDLDPTDDTWDSP